MKKCIPENFEIGNRLRAQRDQLHLTREAMEELSGVSAKYLYELEMAQKNCTTYILLKLCRALNTTPDSILLGDTVREIQAITLLRQLDDKSLDIVVALMKTLLQQSL